MHGHLIEFGSLQGGEQIVDEEGDVSTFVRYSSSPHWGFFRYPGIRELQKLPLAGLRLKRR